MSGEELHNTAANSFPMGGTHTLNHSLWVGGRGLRVCELRDARECGGVG